MRFIIFNGTLKPDAESNTSKVVQMLKLAFEKLGQECKVVTLRDLDYERATKDVKDELPSAVDDAADVMSKYKKAVSEHETRMKKYRKIWKKQGCLHWRKNEDK